LRLRNRNQPLINQNISQSLKGRKFPNRKRGYRHSSETKKRISESVTSVFDEFRCTLPYEKQTRTYRKRILIEEQNRRCAICGQGETWNGRPLVFQLHHKDGNPSNTSRCNETLLCPNCHSQFGTSNTMTDEERMRHRRSVKKAMAEYGRENRQKSQQDSAWKQGIKNHGGASVQVLGNPP
jgi:hypothetical protein